MKTITLSLRPFLIAAALALASVLIGCQSLQPTKTASGGQEATPEAKTLLATTDQVNAAVQAGLHAASNVPGEIGIGAGVLSLLIGYGVKRLHDKLDDITPETPVIATVPAAKS